jgi:hypothetical protein
MCSDLPGAAQLLGTKPRLEPELGFFLFCFSIQRVMQNPYGPEFRKLWSLNKKAFWFIKSMAHVFP